MNASANLLVLFAKTSLARLPPEESPRDLQRLPRGSPGSPDSSTRQLLDGWLEGWLAGWLAGGRMAGGLAGQDGLPDGWLEG